MIWDNASGNLDHRFDELKGLREDFTYDNDRLANWEVVMPYFNNAVISSNSVAFAANGNIESKSDAGGTFQYDPSTKPHAIACVQNPTDELLRYSQDISYTDFLSTKSIVNTAQESQWNNYSLTMHYGADDQRRLQVLKDDEDQIIETKHNAGSFERILDSETNQLREVVYISGGNGICTMHVTTNGNSELYYLHKDHLGSIVAISDAQGQVVHEQNFDPWGRNRNATSWLYEDVDFSSEWAWFDRGYTGHEMLPMFGLINMNGRSYDPLLGRMTQVDNYVQDPYSSQSYNRYSYVWNNPLKYSDPDGEWVHLLAGALIGGFFNWALNGAQLNLQGLSFFAVGALAGALSSGIGMGINSALAVSGSFASGFVGASAVATTGFASGFVSGVSAGFTNGLLLGTGNDLVRGKRFADSLNNGFEKAVDQALISGIVGGVTGGLHAVSNERNFWTGQKARNVQIRVLDNGRIVTLSEKDHYQGRNTQVRMTKLDESNPSIDLLYEDETVKHLRLHHSRKINIQSLTGAAEPLDFLGQGGPTYTDFIVGKSDLVTPTANFTGTTYNHSFKNTRSWFGQFFR